MKEKCLTPSSGGGYAKICDDRRVSFFPLSFRKKEKRREEEEAAAFPISTFLFSHSEICARSRRGSVPFSRIIFAISSISAGGSSIPNGRRGGRAAVNGHFFCLMPSTTWCKGNVCAIHASWHRRRRRRCGHSYQSCRYNMRDAENHRRSWADSPQGLLQEDGIQNGRGILKSPTIIRFELLPTA